MTLNIEPTRTADAGSPDSPAAQPLESPAAQPLVDEVLDELTGWNPREMIGAFQKWHQGSVSLVHLNVLAMLETHGPLPMSRLAEALDISVASMTGVIDRMAKRSLVERQHDVEDRRVVLVATAPGGKAIFTDIDARRRTGLRSLLGRLTDDELTALLRGHRALRAARLAAAASRDSNGGD